MAISVYTVYAFSKVYSENECQVIGIDKNVPMIQILIPENLRDAIRENLNSQLPNC